MSIRTRCARILHALFCYHGLTMTDELAEHLDALARDDCYRVDAVLKQSPFETTERVFFKGANGSELGPFVRKRIDKDSGIGSAYENICAAQKAGRRFVYLPRVIECCDAGGDLVVMMEHVSGETLQEVVYRCDPSLELAIDVFPRLCDAAIELHEGFDAPLIHRDLKPSNIMLSRDSLTVIDFGIARAYKEDSDDDTHHFGTRAYAPPEQFGYGQTDVRSDVYALGMLLYFCLTEKTPDSRTRRGLIQDESIPESVRSIILRAISFDPSSRYGSAAELKSAFLSACGRSAETTECNGGDFAAYQLPRASQAPVADVSGCVGSAGAEHAGQRLDSISRDRVKGSREPRTAFGRVLVRVPFAVGVVWNVLLACLFVLVCVVVAYQIAVPEAGSAQYAAAPLWLRALSYGSLALLVVGPLLYLVSDRRPLARLVPRLAAMPLERDIAATLLVFLAGFLVFGVSGQFFPAL